MASKSPHINELVTCPICFEVYREPKSLPKCLHAFCKSCIKSYLLTAVNTNSNKHDFQCPVCRECYHVNDIDSWVDSLPSNHLIASLIDHGKMENKEQNCDYCTRQGKSDVNLAVSWCPECSDRLCEKCVKFHCVNRLTMEHKLCNIEDRQQTDTLDVELFCKQHASRRLEVYCFDHEEPCCLMCATVSHRKCDKVSSLEECSQSLGADVSRLHGKMEEIQKTCISEIERVTSDKKRLKDESLEIEKKVKTITEEIIQAIKDQERSFLDNLEKIEEKQTALIQEVLDELLIFQKKIEHNIKILNNSEKIHKVALFLELKQMEKRMSEIHFQTKKLTKSYRPSVLHARIDDTVKTFQSSFKTFGEIRMKEMNPLVDYQSTKLVLERTLNVKGSSCLTDVEVIDEDYIVTTCQSNKMLYLLDINGKLLSSLQLKGSPWGISSVQKKTFCVALRDPGLANIFKVQEFSISPWKELTLPLNAWSICAVEDRIIISTERQGGGHVFRIYDQDGKFCKEHEVSVGSPSCGGVTAKSRESLLFTFHSGHSLFSADLNNPGSAIKLYEGGNMSCPIGVTRDPDGNIYVACFDSSNVLQFSESGKYVREIIHSDAAVRSPYGIRVKKLGDGIRLLLTTGGKVLVYRFSD